MTMKKEYDFSKGERGKFYNAKAKFNLPIYLDDDIEDFVSHYAKKNKTDAQTAVNNMLRCNKEMLQPFFAKH